MSAQILQLFGRLSNDQTPEQIRQQRIKTLREDVKNALPGISSTRIAQAQARAERNLRNGVLYSVCVERSIAWAKCATDSTDPDSPKAA